jgi:hypothetical protein
MPQSTLIQKSNRLKAAVRMRTQVQRIETRLRSRRAKMMQKNERIYLLNPLRWQRLAYVYGTHLQRMPRGDLLNASGLHALRYLM